MKDIVQGDTGRRRVTVIGAGNIGICCAIYLQRKGLNVTVIDRLPPGQSCSSGSAGVLSSWSCILDSVRGIASSLPGWLLDPEGPLAIRWRYFPTLVPWLVKFVQSGLNGSFMTKSDALFALNHSTVELYKELLSSAGAPELIRDSSYLFVYRKENAIDPNSRPFQVRRERGARMDFLTGGEVQEVEPEISPQYCRGVAIHDQGHTVNPARLVQALSDYFCHLGGRILTGEVRHVARRGDGTVQVTAAAHDLSSDYLIIAAGAWSHQLTAQLGCRIPLESERGYHMTFANPGVSISHTILEGHRQFVTTEMEMGLRSAGTVEFAGLTAPENPRRSAMLARIARQLLPNLNTSEATGWMGHRSALPDSLPVIGPLPDHPNIIVAFGHGHTGLTAAPMTGKLVADLVAKSSPMPDIARYLPARFL
ncbi:MAG: NAD(P)/FAD-dependent oxidoreductase [Halocynthiibacter sp.]